MIFAKSKKSDSLLNRRNSSAFFLMLLVIFFEFTSVNIYAAPRKSKSDVHKCAGYLSSLTTKSFHDVFEDLTQPSAIKSLGEIYSKRMTRTQKRIDEKVTQAHLAKDMSFQTKNPKTGNYDKFVAVPVNAQLVPMSLTHYQSLVESTEPVLKALRSLLQRLYSGAPLTANGLGLEGLPPSEVEIVKKVIQDSIYFEPALVAPQMKDYPFLSVAGFDGAIVDPKKPQPLFYEINLGTPSGLSNNIQLFDELMKIDKQVAHALAYQLPHNNTFELLRQAIDSNALYWTKTEGISVVLSPGVFNGAHPDVAVIARETQMPLVKSSDLYQDQEGYIRLRSKANPRNDPRVTGIYGRMEESFFFQSDKDNIPLINPNLEAVNNELSIKLGIPLRRGAVYQYIYNDEGQAVDIARDESGKPKFEEVWDKIRLSPTDLRSKRGSFAKAVLNRKLYFSALGGRVADDKRLFRIVARYLAKSEKPVASPIQGLAPYELNEFFMNPDLYVVKEPGNSGGVGIHFVRLLEEPTKANLIERVRQNPNDFEVQLISPIVTIPQAQVNNKSIDVAIDFRLFVMMNGDGSVSAGPQSFLIRTAPEGSLYTNTSRGGGYGIGVVVDEGGIVRRVKDYFRNSSGRYVDIPLSRRQVIGSLLEAYRQLSEELKIEQAAGGARISEKSRERVAEITYLLRDLMDQLDPETLAVIHQLRAIVESEKDGELFALIDLLNLTILKIEKGHIFRSWEMNVWLEELVKHDNAWITAKADAFRRNPFVMIPSEFASRIQFRVLEKPEIAYKFGAGAVHSQKVELAEYIKVDDPKIQSMIDEVRAGGGQVRFLKREHLSYEGKHQFWSMEYPYFWVNLNPQADSYLLPVIGIDITAGHGLSALAHELEHFRLFRKIYLEFKDQGLDHEAATRAAMEKAYNPEYTLVGEKNAVAAEMQAERDFPDSPFNEDIGIHRAKKVYDKGYVNRITYPHFEAIRGILHKQKWSNIEPDLQMIDSLKAEMVKIAEEGRKAALLEVNRLLGEQKGAQKAKSWEVFELREAKDFWTSASIYEILFYPYGLERISQDKTRLEFERLFADLRDTPEALKN